MKIKGYLINPDLQLIYPVRVERHEVSEYRKHIKCDAMDSAVVFKGNRAWVDDDGIRAAKTPFVICGMRWEPQVLFGRALILGSNPPNCTSANCTIDEVRHYTLPVSAVIGNGGEAKIIANLEGAFELAENEPA